MTVTYDMLSKAADRLHDSEVAVKKKLAVVPPTHTQALARTRALTHTHAGLHACEVNVNVRFEACALMIGEVQHGPRMAADAGYGHSAAWCTHGSVCCER